MRNSSVGSQAACLEMLTFPYLEEEGGERVSIRWRCGGARRGRAATHHPALRPSKCAYAVMFDIDGKRAVLTTGLPFTSW